MSFKILSVKDSDEWNRLINNLPIEQQDIYYTPEYYSLYENYGDGKAQCFVFEENGELALYPFLINSVNKLGYQLDDEYFDIQGAYGYNGVVSSTYSPDFINSFHNHFKNYCINNNIIAEFTRFHPILKNESFSFNMNVIEDRKTVLLDITKDYDFIWKNCYSSINRNMIRKALKKNISISISDIESDYIDFFDIYELTMQNIGAEEYYFFSENYFKHIKTHLQNNHRLIIAKIDDKIICAMILMFNGKYAHYHLSARLKEFSNTGVNNLILNEAIKIAKSEGCSFFHFGGGSSTLQNDSLLKFKSNFSKEKRDFYIGKKIHNSEIYTTIINQWMQKYPQSYTLHKNKLLGYREI